MKKTTITVDLRDRIAELDDALEGIKREAGELEAQADNETDVRQTQAYRELVEEYQELEHAKELLEKDIDAFGGSEFTIKKFRGGDQERVTDLVLQDTLEDDNTDPRTKLGARKLRSIQVAVTSAPPEAPTKPHAFSNPTKEYLYECIDELNRFGEVGIDLEDFSIPLPESDVSDAHN